MFYTPAAVTEKKMVLVYCNVFFILDPSYIVDSRWILNAFSSLSTIHARLQNITITTIRCSLVHRRRKINICVDIYIYIYILTLRHDFSCFHSRLILYSFSITDCLRIYQ